jgi:hypothetical protein
MHAPNGQAQHGGMGRFSAGNLRGTESAELGNGVGDDGELLSTGAGGRKVRGVFHAKAYFTPKAETVLKVALRLAALRFIFSFSFDLKLPSLF